MFKKLSTTAITAAILFAAVIAATGAVPASAVHAPLSDPRIAAHTAPGANAGEHRPRP
ncbi:hypothetical protein [Streptomyces sp. NPDC088261]|uniref:hypothetical protein n=1 Tax=Streptomyces sp. NPDC088261 TaxID=3365851 RepID=UPI0038002F03